MIVTVERIPLEDLEDDLPDVKGCNVWKRTNHMVQVGFTTARRSAAPTIPTSSTGCMASSSRNADHD